MSRRRRPGVAAVWVMVVLAVLAALTAGLVRQFYDLRRAQAAHEGRVQARWLARSGVELAAARLLADGAKYEGEKASPVPGSLVTVRVTPGGDADTFRVECEARVTPPAGSGPVVERVARTVTRTGKGVEVGGRSAAP